MVQSLRILTSEQLAALVWSNVLTLPLALFTGHPVSDYASIWSSLHIFLSLNQYHCQLLASTALLLQVQAALILQPTTTPDQKLLGTRIHYTIQLLSILCFLSAFLVIEFNKGDHPHFVSPHGILGLVTIVAIVLQASVGVIQFFFPATVLGSVDAGKRVYKYHRWAGYVLLLLEVSTVLAATQTPYNLNAIHIPTWGVIIAIILVLLGAGARIKKGKLGLGDV